MPAGRVCSEFRQSFPHHAIERCQQLRNLFREWWLVQVVDDRKNRIAAFQCFHRQIDLSTHVGVVVLSTAPDEHRSIAPEDLIVINNVLETQGFAIRRRVQPEIPNTFVQLFRKCLLSIR